MDGASRMRRVRRLATIVALGSVLATLHVPVASAAQPTELFISEYVEGISNDKAVEIYNGTGSPIDLASIGYGIEIYANGSVTPTSTIPLSGTVADGAVHVVANEGSTALFALANQTSAALNFNGNDAVVLRVLSGGAVLDIIGQIGVDPGASGWGSGEQITANRTLVRKPSITAGRTVDGPFDPAIEWNILGFDYFDALGWHMIDQGPADPTPGPDTGIVAADVTAATAVACIELSTASVTFGEQRYGAENVLATPGITITNCSATDAQLHARGTDATSATATWNLVDDAGSCGAGTLQADDYHLKLRRPANEVDPVTSLSTTNKEIAELAGGDATNLEALLDMPCPGSSGSGQNLTMQIVFLVTEDE